MVGTGASRGKRVEKSEELRQLGHLWVPFHVIRPSERVPLAPLKGMLMSLVKAPSAPEPSTFLATSTSTGQQAIPYQVISRSRCNLDTGLHQNSREGLG